eukprot:CAMPEP_0198268796 /NCGR_PEP_ID=MMETSP1447-20131203/38806_1 /TAXON_ID=420782 /ORGANISM="Chaetoceros dichaeta, Strain CCMP1751" /LENGTH=108 /DNA_ID=CAMNT_0043960047 /DNA_START=251 /DNA_END=574 /DNA_ORIENTATION=+
MQASPQHPSRSKLGVLTDWKYSGGTVKSIVTNVRLTFWTNLRPDPALDLDQRQSLFLTRQLMGYVDSDGATKQQKALPPSVFKSMLRNTFTPMDESLGQLFCGAFFFR